MFWRLYLALSSLNSICRTLGATCEPRAISLPLKNYTLETRAVARGISFQIGRPNAQQLVLVPNPWYIDTYLWGSADGFCPTEWTDEVCVTYRGGQYDSSRSDGAKPAGTVKRVDDDTPSNWTLDDVKLQNTTMGNIDLPQFEFGVRTTQTMNAFVHKGEIGLAKGSSLLKVLADGNRTSSNTWSLFWGSEVTRPPRDGSITFGGYDEAIIGDSQNITVDFNQTTGGACKQGLVVEITGMSLQNATSSQDVMEGLGTQKVCIEPAVSNLLTLPVAYWDRMESIMGVERNSFMNGTAETYFYNTTIVKASSVTYTGNLTITINDALTFTIPNDQLIFNETYIEGDQGLIQTKPDIKSIPIVRRDDIMPRIGGMFFSVAYLIVNNDKEQFTITQAQPTPAKQKLIGIDTANDCVAQANVVGGEPTTPSSTLPSPKSNGSSLSGGAIAGIVVGSIGGLALIAGIAFILWRRRSTGAPASDSGIPLETHVPVEKYGHNASELYSDVAATELGHSDYRQYAVELDGVAKPSEAPEYEALSAHGHSSRS